LFSKWLFQVDIILNKNNYAGVSVKGEKEERFKIKKPPKNEGFQK